jgi:FAD:protein FMN transferase
MAPRQRLLERTTSLSPPITRPAASTACSKLVPTIRTGAVHIMRAVKLAPTPSQDGHEESSSSGSAGEAHTEASVSHIRALGTTVTLRLEDPERMARARSVLASELDAIDSACSRFRPYSEIWALYASGGEKVRVSALLFEIIATACDVAQLTGGAVDPTVGTSLETLGYDRDFAQVVNRSEPLSGQPHPAAGWWRVELDASTRAVRIPPGVKLDLGCVGNAFAADRAAANISSLADCGVSVRIGDDVSFAGESPPGGWLVDISSGYPFAVEGGHEPANGMLGQTVRIVSGGVATSSTSTRRWLRGTRRFHHIVDPFTGDVASEHWAQVSVAAASCVDANAASTAAIVWGEHAIARLEALDLPCRLVRNDGRVATVGAWPSSRAV